MLEMLLAAAFLAPCAPAAPVAPISPSFPKFPMFPTFIGAPVQEPATADLVLDRARAAGDLELEDLWREARTLGALVDAEEGATLDKTLDAALKAGGELSPRGLVLVAAVRLQGDDLDWELVIDRLQPLLAGDDPVAARGAASLLGDPALRPAVTREQRSALADALVAVAQDEDRPPRLRVECAVAANEVGLGSHISSARAVLFDFEASADSTLSTLGVLALGRLGLFDRVEDRLYRISLLPGEDGLLARALLDVQEVRRTMERRVQRARDLGAGGGELPKDLERVERVIDAVQRFHLEGATLTREGLIDAALGGMLRSLDKHSAYMPSDAYGAFEQELEAEYGGIGAYVGTDRDDGLFTITRPIYSGPAYRGGLMTDDKIVKIGDWPTIGEDVDDIIKRLKGRPGTGVKLYVWRRGMDTALIERPTEDMAVELERAQITIPPVTSEFLPGDIGLVQLDTFSRVASMELHQRLVDMHERGMKAVVLDLRRNYGGLLEEAVRVADLFLPEDKTVVFTEDRLGKRERFATREAPLTPPDMPIAVIVDRFSASAAEIVAGALQDHGRAVLVGERTYGKGSVQNLYRVPGEQDDQYEDENRNHRRDNWEPITRDWDEDGEFDYAPRIKLTIQRYLLPSERSIHRELDADGNIVSAGGIDPDVEIEPRRWEQWRLQEMVRLQRGNAGQHPVRDWVKDQFEAHRDEFERLAYSDRDDSEAYPGFRELYETLDTVLAEEDVRYLVRLEVRRLVQDLRGEAFPTGDYEEDLQLQEALRQVLAKLGLGVEDVPEYAATFDPVEAGDETEALRPFALVSPSDAQRRSLENALTLLSSARDSQGRLSDEDLARLTEIIEELKRN